MRADDDTKKMFVSVAEAAVDLFVAIILLGTLLYFVLVLIIGIDTIRGLQKFASASSDIMISLLIIVCTVLILVFLAMFLHWLSRDEGGIMILPFEVAAGEDKYSGEAVSHLVIAELLRIRRIHETEYRGISPVESERFNFPILVPSSENLTYTVSQLGPVALGTTSIHIGPLIAILKKLWPKGDNGQVISGSLQKYGSAIILLACLEHQKIRAWEVSAFKDGDQVGDEIVPTLARDLAFKMVQDLSQKEISAKTWQGFKHFTEALEAYHQYNLTGDMSHLEVARKECLKAANSEASYGKLLELIYNIGMAYTNKKQLFRAEELLFQAITIKPDDDFSLFGLGYLHGVQHQHQKALDYFERAITANPKFAESWFNKGVALDYLGRKEEAIKAYDEACVLNPQDTEAQLNKRADIRNLDESVPSFTSSQYRSAGKYSSMPPSLQKKEKIQHGTQQYSDPKYYDMACDEAVHGGTDFAIKLLRLALNRNEVQIEWARRDPDFEFIRDDPRFEALLDEFSEDGKKGPK